jgi:hypothetical protein
MAGYGIVVLLVHILGHLVVSGIIGAEFLLIPSVFDAGDMSKLRYFVHQPSLVDLMGYVTYSYPALFILFVICTAFFTLISAFLLHHTYLMCTNATTNEQHKRGEWTKGKEIHGHYKMLQSAAKEKEIALKLTETQYELLQLEPRLHMQHPEQTNAILTSAMTATNKQLAKDKMKGMDFKNLSSQQRKARLEELYTLQDNLLKQISEARRELHEMPDPSEDSTDSLPIPKEEIKLRKSLPNPYNLGIVQNLIQFWFPSANKFNLSSSWTSAYANFEASSTSIKKAN